LTRIKAAERQTAILHLAEYRNCRCGEMLIFVDIARRRAAKQPWSARKVHAGAGAVSIDLGV